MGQDKIDWANFSQGAVSDDMWGAFKALVYESHDYVKHMAEAREARQMARVRDPSAHSRRHHEREWERSALLHDNKWHRAEFLAHEALNQIDKIGREKGSESPDRRFSDAVITAVGPLRDQTRCDFSVTALHCMDAAFILEIPSDQITEQLRSLRLLTPSQRG
jgi:hypothetical protein